jgi:hypothetical protein
VYAYIYILHIYVSSVGGWVGGWVGGCR